MSVDASIIISLGGTCFDAFKSGYHKLQNLKIWSKYQDLLQTKCEFLQKSFNPELAAQLNNQVLNTILSFQDAIELDTLTLVMFEALQFTVPLDSEQSDLPKWILRDYDAQMQVNWLKAPMDGSVVYKASRVGARGVAKKRAADPSNPSKARPKKVARGIGGIAMAVPDEQLELTVETDATTRSKMWLDDLVSAVTHPLSLLPADALQKQSICKAFRSGLEFCFTGKVSLGGQDLRAWSKVRKALQTDLVREHATAFRHCPSVARGGASSPSSTEMADAVIDAVGDIPNKKQGGKLKEMEDDMAEFIQNERFVLDLSAFVHTNRMALSITLQPAYLDLSQKVQRSIIEEAPSYSVLAMIVGTC
jgi:hypothetical protein